jgi:hypothetical protein
VSDGPWTLRHDDPGIVPHADWKVPWRAVYACTFGGWLRACATCALATVRHGWPHRLAHWRAGVPREHCFPDCKL